MLGRTQSFIIWLGHSRECASSWTAPPREVTLSIRQQSARGGSAEQPPRGATQKSHARSKWSPKPSARIKSTHFVRGSLIITARD